MLERTWVVGTSGGEQLVVDIYVIMVGTYVYWWVWVGMANQ